ncbi:regenerating islet-derived protein 3-alpha-like isoform X2 [Onychomys torridus]|uniref:regenerating islet-derived protein 3-alpha-like isoform X2 n=1 Tax=Onychomys torridus TaxID=38674 RepID=UPI00167F89EC|nr:regenerating islet-derived protein 3-alpha-like isoform X2 [Onychomys torridus]
MLYQLALSSVSRMLFSCLMLLSQVQGEDSQKKVPSPRISCPTGSKVYHSYCYTLFMTPKSWYQADGQEPNGGGWKWSNSDIMNYFNWDGNPSAVNSGHCGSLTASSGFLKWGDHHCDGALPFVCKFKE